MNGNEPAMPVPEVGEGGSYTNVVNTGLTKRELFAGLAMQALLTNGSYEFHGAGIDAVKFADGLIKALAEPPK